jgi:uncharacterized protein YlxW (UPF0749 family)
MQRSSPSQSQRLVQVTIASGVALLVGFLLVVQLRSQAVVVRHLAGQDNTTIALLINNLNRGNTALLEEIFALESRRTRLRSDLATGQGDAGELERETIRLRIVNGTVGVHGSGIVLRLEGALYDSSSRTPSIICATPVRRRSRSTATGSSGAPRFEGVRATCGSTASRSGARSS